jgi:hypothetical protein
VFLIYYCRPGFACMRLMIPRQGPNFFSIR